MSTFVQAQVDRNSHFFETNRRGCVGLPIIYLERGARTMTSFHAQLNQQHQDVLQFPRELPRTSALQRSRAALSDRWRSLDLADRRMWQLARTLGCLGYFESDGNGPRAA